MNHPSAYLLVSHGSRDPRPQQAMAGLATEIAERLSLQPLCQPDRSDAQFRQGDSAVVSGVLAQPTAASVLVETAVLELHPLPLHQQIQAFAERAIFPRYPQGVALGYRSIKIVPLFLLAGVHVTEDIPTEVAIAQHQLGDRLTVETLPHIGSHLSFQNLVVDWLETVAGETPILLSHGSRRLEGNVVIEAIAQRLGGVPAYWSIPPSVEAQVAMLVQQGCSRIAILPYFLFAGSITDAIAQQVERLMTQFPDVRFRLLPPLSDHPRFADRIVELL